MSTYYENLRSFDPCKLRHLCKVLGLEECQQPETMCHTISDFVLNYPDIWLCRLPYKELKYLLYYPHLDTEERYQYMPIIEKMGFNIDTPGMRSSCFLCEDIEEILPGHIESSMEKVEDLAYNVYYEYLVGCLASHGVVPIEDIKEVLKMAEIRIKSKRPEAASSEQYIKDNFLIPLCSFEYKGITYVYHHGIQYPNKIIELKNSIGKFFPRKPVEVKYYKIIGEFDPHIIHGANFPKLQDFRNIMKEVGYDSEEIFDMYDNIFLALNQGEHHVANFYGKQIIDKYPKKRQKGIIKRISEAYEQIPFWPIHGLSYIFIFLPNTNDGKQLDLIEEALSNFWDE